MTSPVFLADLTGAMPGGSVTVTGSEAQHAAVMRIQEGDAVDLVDGGGLRARCRVSSSDRSALIARVESLESDDDATPVVLVQALAKGGRDEAAVEMATEVGVDAVVPWQADRSIAKWPAAKAGKMAERWRSTLVAAAKQSRRARVPELRALENSRTLAARLAEVIDEGGLVLVLHESATAPLHRVDIPRDRTSQVWLVVGPEGGIGEAELDAFVTAGALPVRAGRTVMRASTAGAIGVSHVARALGRWEIVGQSGGEPG